MFFRNLLNILEKLSGSPLENDSFLENFIKKLKYPLRFSYVNWKVFAEILNPHWFVAQTRKILPLGFLNSCRFIRAFQEAMKGTLLPI